MDQKLKNFLYSNPAKNLAAIGFFSSYPIEDYYIEGSSALVVGRSDNLWIHIISSSPKELSILLNKYSKISKHFFSVEDWMIPIIKNLGNSDWIMTTNRYVLNNIISPYSNGLVIKPIDISFANYIYSNSDYKKFTSVEYIVDRLEKDISAGIWINDKLIAWGFTHDDGALGFLHVLEDYRKKGYSKILLKHLISSRQKSNKSVFVNIVPENVPAINLITNLGFEFDCKASWIKLL